MTKKILVTGASGLVGSRFVELHEPKSELLTPPHEELDITSHQSVTDYFFQHHPEVVINFAAYTNVGQGEKQRDDKNGDCWKLNVDGVGNLVQAMDKKSVHFIQISTEYVFSGSKNDPGPYGEDHPPEKDSAKLTWYGFTKAEAERIVLERLKEKATIVRLVYPVRAKFDRKPDYLRKMLRLFDERKLFPLFTDIKISISFIDEICKLLDRIIVTETSGIFHSASRDMVSPFELCSYLFEKVRGDQNVVQPALFSEFIKTITNPVRYPQFGGLKVKKTEKRLGLKFSTWRTIIDRLLQQGI